MATSILSKSLLVALTLTSSSYAAPAQFSLSCSTGSTESTATTSPRRLGPIISTLGGCGKALIPTIIRGGDSQTVNITQTNGTPRSYLIHVPTNYNTTVATPLIFSFSGHNRTAASQEALSELDNETWNPDAIVVYPTGLDDSWQGAPYAVEGVDDLEFTNNMIDDLNSNYCIDNARIYATGKSNGGGFVGTLACDSVLSTKIAAFAPVSGAFYVPGSSNDSCSPTSIEISCSPGRTNIPIIDFHGNNDTTIDYTGGGRSGECLPSIPYYIQQWSDREGYGTANKTTNLYGGNVQKFEFGGLAGTGDLGIITQYTIDGLNHSWPSLSPNDDNPYGTYLDATPLIMDFFNKYTL